MKGSLTLLSEKQGTRTLVLFTIPCPTAAEISEEGDSEFQILEHFHTNRKWGEHFNFLQQLKTKANKQTETWADSYVPSNQY